MRRGAKANTYYMNASLVGVELINGPYELQVTLKTDLCITKSCTNKTIQLFLIYGLHALCSLRVSSYDTHRNNLRKTLFIL